MMFLSLLKPQILIHFYSKSCMILMTLSIYQYKIQYILPNTFANKESIAQEDSLHNQLKNFISYPLIVWGGGAGHWNDPTQGVWTLPSRPRTKTPGGVPRLQCAARIIVAIENPQALAGHVSSEQWRKGLPGGVGYFLGGFCMCVCVFIYIYIYMYVVTLD